MSHGPPTIGGIGLDLSDDIICRATQAGISQRHMKTIPIIRDRTRNRLLTLRLLSIAAMLSLIILVPALLAIPLPATPLLVVIGILALASLFGIAPNRRALPITSLETWIHLSIDLAGWSAFLYYSGGATNPAISILLPPVAIGAAMLPATHAWALAGTAIGAYTLLWEYHRPLDVYDSALAINWHLAGMWLTFSISAALITFYIVRMTAAIRSRDLALAQARERALRDERILALGSLAAGAAHELGTPLSTITLVTSELLRELKSTPHGEDLVLLRDQAARCREILQKLTRTPGEQDDWYARLTLRELVDEASQAYRCGPTVVTVEAGPDTLASGTGVLEPIVVRRPGLIYGLGNLIENAVDYAERGVAIDARWSQTTVSISIADDGPGFAPELIETLGEPYISTRRQNALKQQRSRAGGLGLGFFIAKTLLERSGAQISLENRQKPEHGAIVTVSWPRDSFERQDANATA